MDIDAIACVAPQMKEYEVPLRLLLKKESFPVFEPRKVGMSSYPEIHAWLSELQVALESFESGHLEMALFSSEKSLLPYSEFIRLYKIIYDSADLQRASKVYEEYQARPKLHRHRLDGREFMEWALTRWSGREQSRLIRIIEKFLADGPAGLELPAKDWLLHLQTVSFKCEEKIEEGGSGIQLADLHSSENLQATHIVVMGLSEQSLRRPRKLGLLPKDLWSIQREIGFNLPLIEDVSAEFDAQWLVSGRDKTISLLCPLADWDGTTLSPSLFWFRFQNEEVEASSPGKTLWDTKNHEITQAVEKDLLGVCELKGRRPQKLSVSSIEDYLKCPFIYSAKKVFRCDDSESVDLELGPQSSGRFRHLLLERLLEKSLDWKSEELKELVETCAEELGVNRAATQVWESQKRRFVAFARRFLEFEKEWKLKFPQTRTLARELAFEIYFDPETCVLSKEGPGIWVRGSIDRVDEDEAGRVVIIDYKPSVHKQSSWKNWVEKKQLQLGFYSDVVSSGLTELGTREVVGAFYMSLRDFERAKGFAREDADGVLFEIGSKKFGLTESEASHLFQDIRKVIANTVTNMEKGILGPTPSDQDDCEQCRWELLCRGAHLL